jgi:hypothetical protein
MEQSGCQPKCWFRKSAFCLPSRTVIKSKLKSKLQRVHKAVRRIKTLSVDGGLVLFFTGRLLIRGLRISVISGHLVVGGVPISIIFAFLRDKTARKAYFRRNSTALHDRLCDMGIEARIKDFYRSQIPDEAELDRYIHQLLYDHTGYVGKDYYVNSKGILIFRKSNREFT